MTGDLPTPDCPGCECAPAFTVGRTSFCPDLDCHVLNWNPYLPLEELMNDVGTIDPSGLVG